MANYTFGDTPAAEANQLQWHKIQDGDKTLLICDRVILVNCSWNDLNSQGYITGKEVTIDGAKYKCRVLTGGTGPRSSNDYYSGGTPTNNEWDRFITREEVITGLPAPVSSDLDSTQNATDLNSTHNQFWNWYYVYSWCQETYSGNSSYRAYRGYISARFWNYYYASYQFATLGFRPVLEVLNADTLGSDGLKAVTLDLNGGKLGGSSDDIQIIVKNGSTFTAPVSDGLTRPDGDTGNYFMWLGSDGKFYATGDSVPAGVTKLTAQFAVPSYTVTLNGVNSDATGAGNYAVGVTVSIYAGTKSGYSFNGWTSDNVTITNANNKNASFTMPAKDVTVTANWTKNSGGGGGGETPHSHSYGGWKSDSANHWKECSCSDKAQIGAHSFKWVVDKAATATQKGSKHEECTVCGYKRPAVEIPAAGGTTPVRPNNPDTGALDNVPKTGDSSSLSLWIALLFVSGAGITSAAVYGRKKKENAE